jgi:predicted RNase H-like nuclease
MSKSLETHFEEVFPAAAAAEIKKLKERIKEDYKIIEFQEERINELHIELQAYSNRIIRELEDELDMMLEKNIKD